MNMNFPIDFVVEWVDGNDFEWRQRKEKYISDKSADTRAVRYRDWNILRFWFRAVENYAPWVNKIHFVVDHQIPKWLNVENDKIHIVNHEDYIDSKYLPVFNSSAIEVGINRIPGLAEHFVFFNDDFFLNAPVTPEDFFSSDGLPCDSAVLSAQIPKRNSITHITTNDMEIINENFSRKDVFKHLNKFLRLSYGKQNVKTLTTLVYPILLGFQDFHIAISLTKTTMNHVWKIAGRELLETQDHRFRTKEDLNIFLFRYFQLLSGQFEPREVSFGKYYDLSDNNEKIFSDLKSQKHKLIVLNDQEAIRDFEKQQEALQQAFLSKLPTKSGYELE